MYGYLYLWEGKIKRQRNLAMQHTSKIFSDKIKYNATGHELLLELTYGSIGKSIGNWSKVKTNRNMCI